MSAKASNAEQLTALGDVARLFDDAGVEYWLFGGWAVDFYAGEATRMHDDIDFAVWRADVEQISELLERHDWRHAPYDDEDGGTGYERAGVRVEVTYLERDGTGIVIPMRHGRVAWSDAPFGDEKRELHGTTARIIPLSLLTRGKSTPRDDPGDAAKDRADFERLRALADLLLE